MSFSMPSLPARRLRLGAARRRVAFLAALLAGTYFAASVSAQEEAAEPEPTTAPNALAQFTTAVEDREPVDQVTFVSNDVRKIFFFSDLRNLAGQTVIHRWIHEGETRAEVRFEVGGPRWRVWSSKELLEDWIGDWTVEIVTGEGEVIAAETFTYSPAGA